MCGFKFWLCSLLAIWTCTDLAPSLHFLVFKMTITIFTKYGSMMTSTLSLGENIQQEWKSSSIYKKFFICTPNHPNMRRLNGYVTWMELQSYWTAFLSFPLSLLSLHNVRVNESSLTLQMWPPVPNMLNSNLKCCSTSDKLQVRRRTFG